MRKAPSPPSTGRARGRVARDEVGSTLRGLRNKIRAQRTPEAGNFFGQKPGDRTLEPDATVGGPVRDSSLLGGYGTARDGGEELVRDGCEATPNFAATSRYGTITTAHRLPLFPAT